MHDQSEVPFQDLQRIDELVDRFEDAWLSGSSPAVADYLEQFRESSEFLQRKLLIELVVIDLAHRWRRNDLSIAADRDQQTIEQANLSHPLPARPKVEDYLSAIPQLGSNNDVPLELIVEEYRARRRCGERPSLDEYRRRFPGVSAALESELRKADQELDVADNRSAVDTDRTSQTVRTQSGETLSKDARSFGDYEILEEIAHGGMGIVYKARHVKLNRIVALKTIKSGGRASDEEVRRFQVEAEAAAALDHRHIVPIYEVGQHNGEHFLAMAFVDGISLSDRFHDGPLPQREAAALIRTVAIAIDHAHQHGVVHRDLKPANILIGADGEPRITDFGLAKQVDSGHDLTMSGQILGTPSFMAPEQAAGRSDIGPAADVYALGAVLYNALAGRPPFQADNVVDILHQTLNQEPVSPRQLNPRLDRDLDTICVKALAKSPARRYTSAAAFADDLDRYLAGQPILARPVSSRERLWRWCRRNPAVSGLIAAVMLALVAGAVIASYYAIRADQQATRFLQQKNRADEEATRAWRGMYLARMALVQRDWESGEVELASRNLDVASPQHTGGHDLRNFEWHYWQGRMHQDIFTLEAGSNSYDVEFSPDGKQLLSAHEKSIRIWDVVSGKLAISFDTDSSFTDVAFNPAGTHVAATRAGGPVMIWDLETREPAMEIMGHLCVAFDATGNRIAYAGADSLKISDSKTGKELIALRPAVAWSDRVENHLGFRPSCVAFRPDGKQIAAGSQDSTLTIWDIDSGEVVRTIDHPQIVNSLAYTPDGCKVVTSCSDGMIRLWKADTGEEIHKFDASSFPVFSKVDFSPDGRWIAGGGLKKKVWIWDAITGRQLLQLEGHAGVVYGVAFSPDGTRIASSSEDGTIKIWNTTQPNELAGHRDAVRWAAFRPDGEQIATASQDHTIKIWDARTHQELQTLRGHTEAVISVAYRSDGRFLISSSEDGTVRLWSAKFSQTAKTFRGHKGAVNSVAFNPDGERIVSGGIDKSVRIWSVETGEQVRVLEGHAGTVTGVTFSPDGTLVASSSSEAVNLWDTKTGNLIRQMPGQSTSDSKVLFSPNGKLLVCCGDQIVISEVSSGRIVQRLAGHGHHSVVTSVAFDASGSRLASGSRAMVRSVKLWDVQTGQDLLTLESLADVNCVTFSPDGTRLAAAMGYRYSAHAPAFTDRRPPTNAVQFWDARQLTPELRADREALSFASYYFQLPLGKNIILQRIRDDEKIRESVRQRALELADRYQDRAKRFRRASWRIARRPGASFEEYGQGLSYALVAIKLDPNDTRNQLTAAFAYYRLGDFPTAFEFLTKLENQKPEPQYQILTDCLFLMIQSQIDKVEKTDEMLVMLRESIKNPKWNDDEALRVIEDLLGEAQALIDSHQQNME